MSRRKQAPIADDGISGPFRAWVKPDATPEFLDLLRDLSAARERNFARAQMAGTTLTSERRAEVVAHDVFADTDDED